MNDDEKDNRKDLLVTIADANFIKQAKQLFSSVYFNAGWQGDYMLLTSGLSDDDAAWFKSKGILVYAPPLLTDSPLGIKAYPPILLSKFYLFQEDFKKWRKIIFLDSDILVEASLDRLLALDGFNAAEAITFRLRNEFIGDDKRLQALKERYDLRALAFSTGVFSFETDLIGSATFAEIMALHERYRDVCEYGEESILNLYFYKHWRLLPVIYNAIPWHMKIAYGIRTNKLKAFIIHSICSLKPWEASSPYYQEWLDNLHRAEMIDLDKRPAAVKIWSDKEYRDYLIFLKLKKAAHAAYPLLLGIDRQIGRLGLLIKKKNPGLYRLIRLKKDDE